MEVGREGEMDIKKRETGLKVQERRRKNERELECRREGARKTE